MESSTEAVVKSNAELKKQLDVANANLLALQAQIAKLIAGSTSVDDNDEGGEAASSSKAKTGSN